MAYSDARNERERSEGDTSGRSSGGGGDRAKRAEARNRNAMAESRGSGSASTRSRNLNALDALAASGSVPQNLDLKTGKSLGPKSGSNNRPSGPFQTARYSKLTPNDELPSTGVGQGIADMIGGIVDGDVYSKYGEPDLAPKDITPQDVDALGSNMGGTGANQDRGGQVWLDQRRTQSAAPITSLPDAPAMTLDDYLNELTSNYINPNMRYYLEQRGLVDPSAPAGIPAEWQMIQDREFNRIKNQLPGDLIGEGAKEADVFNQLRNYYSDQFGKNALDSEELRRRNDFTTQLNNKGFRNQVTGAFGDTSDDALIESIINPQYQAAQDLLTNQQKRGTLTGTGYNYGMQKLGEQRNAANTKLQGIGATQRATTSGGVSDYLDEIYGKAGNYKLGEQFDPNAFDTEFGNRLTSATGSLEGNIRGAAPTNLFDTSTVLSNAGTAQGQSSRGGILDTLSQRRNRTQSRGLGSTGAF